MRLKLAAAVVVLVAAACGDDVAGPPPGNVIDLYDPCTIVSTATVSEAVGFPMIRETSINEDADRFRSCRWVATPADTDPASIDYLDVSPRPFVDVVLRQTGVDDEASVDIVFAEVAAASNSRDEPSLLSTDDNPYLADDARRTDTAVWAIKDDRMLIITTSDAAFLDGLIESVGPALLDRL
ncbi:MAG: hypothetical protein AAF548_15285 [Actinomycetota bacterium]